MQWSAPLIVVLTLTFGQPASLAIAAPPLTQPLPPLGKVEVVKGELLLRYRPSPPRTIAQESEITAIVNGATQNFTSKKFVRMAIDPAAGNRITMRFELADEAAREPDFRNPSGVFVITAGDRGNPYSVGGSMNVPGHGRQSLDGLNSADKAIVLDFAKRIFPPYPEGGVKSGDVVFIVSLNKIVPTDAFGWNTTGGSAIGRLRGVTKYQGRQMAVIDWETDFGLYDKASNITRSEFSFTGFSIVDIDTGMSIRQEISGRGTLTKDGQTIAFTIAGKLYAVE